MSRPVLNVTRFCCTVLRSLPRGTETRHPPPPPSPNATHGNNLSSSETVKSCVRPRPKGKRFINMDYFNIPSVQRFCGRRVKDRTGDEDEGGKSSALCVPGGFSFPFFFVTTTSSTTARSKKGKDGTARKGYLNCGSVSLFSESVRSFPLRISPNLARLGPFPEGILGCPFPLLRTPYACVAATYQPHSLCSAQISLFKLSNSTNGRPSLWDFNGAQRGAVWHYFPRFSFLCDGTFVFFFASACSPSSHDSVRHWAK